MVLIETFLGMARYLTPRSDDDWSDRLNYLYTPNILLAFSILVSFKQFGGRPLECMFPNKFPSSWEQYAENFCWAQDTYFVEPSVHVEALKPDERMVPDRQMSYYQWVPFLLILQAAFFRAPSFVWKYFSDHSGIRIHEVVERASESGNVDEDNKTRNIGILEKHLKRALHFQRRMNRKKLIIHKTITCLNYQYSSGFMTSMYLFTKLLYLTNVAAQLWLMNMFLETSTYRYYGLGVIYDIMRGVTWETSGHFPRVSVCDFTVRQVANIQKYSVQCVLIINIFNEKIFVFLWFWYVIIFVCTFLSFIYWFLVMTFPCFSRWFISQHLELSDVHGFDPKNKKSAHDVYKFVHSYLHRDGVFVLRMVSSHAGIIFGTDLILALWNAYYGMEKKRMESDRDSSVDEEAPKPKTETVRHRKKKSLNLNISGDLAQHLIPLSPDAEKRDESASSDEHERFLQSNSPVSLRKHHDSPKEEEARISYRLSELSSPRDPYSYTADSFDTPDSSRNLLENDYPQQ